MTVGPDLRAAAGAGLRKCIHAALDDALRLVSGQGGGIMSRE
jgi:hypothetical protein